MADLSSDQERKVQDILNKLFGMAPRSVDVKNEKVLELTARAVETLLECNKGMGIMNAVKNFSMTTPVRSGSDLVMWLLEGLGGTLFDQMEKISKKGSYARCIEGVQRNFGSHIRIAGTLG